ncbi:DUF1648 domain-containing protein [Kaistella palustris]|uniref:DUF1648 domain-containing protein n=1 Tax=Kaistella palustris TaxID=493376 RepID=UPI0004817B7F|nr:DUF1648 domain-containing protein [Kaistella palustris]
MKALSFFLKIIAFGILIFIWDYIFIHYRELPAVIPVHFDLQGNADGYGTKMLVWLEAGIAAVLYFFLFYLSKNSESVLLNLPANIKENPQTAEIAVDGLNILVMIVFAVITYESIQVGLSMQKGLGTASNYILGGIFLYVAVILIYSWQLSRRANAQNQEL